MLVLMLFPFSIINHYIKEVLFFIIIAITSLSVINAQTFELQMDSIIHDAIDSMAFPGAQVLVMKDGNVVFEKAYGHHTYEAQRKVEMHHLYDLASITKVSSGLPLLMNLVAKGKVELDKPASKYITTFKSRNKKEVTIREILAHQAGLLPYIVYYAGMQTDDGHWKRRTFKDRMNRKYPVQITDSLFMHRRYQKKMSKRIKQTNTSEKTYRYSGLFFQLLPQLIENLKGNDFLDVINTELYRPLQIENGLTYLPLEKHPLEDIIPTEIDTNFRNQLVHGTVHDEAAAMWGGVSCNAGLFGNAKSLATLFQVYIDDGFYQGRKFIDSSAISQFTKCQYCETDNRRGLGFDKPLIEYDAESSYVAKDASSSSFGHSGFTGTFVWADPKHDLVFVFLSNRVYPSRSHRNLYRMNIRPSIHQLAYDYFVDN